MKVALFLIGQSNEQGNCKLYLDGISTGGSCVTKRAEFGPPNESELSYWPYCTEQLWQTDQVYMRIYETAMSGSSIIADWCGDTAGDGSGTIYSKDDVGFDPNGLFAGPAAGGFTGDTIGELLAAYPSNGYDEAWAVISIGNNDSSINTSRANFKQGYINSAEWCLANGINRVFMGLSPPSKNIDIATSLQRYTDNLDPGVQDALANYSGDSRILEGANAWRLFSGNTGVLWDNNHLDQNSTIRAGREWAKIISNSLAGNASAYY